MYRWIFFVCFLLIACKGSTEVPNNIMGYDQMKETIWDLAQVDEFAATYLIRDSARNVHKESLIMYQKVFALHKISNDEFARSYAFYKSHPLQEKVLMDSLSQFSGRQRDGVQRYVSPILPKRLISPAPIKMGIGDWRDLEITNRINYE